MRFGADARLQTCEVGGPQGGTGEFGGAGVAGEAVDRASGFGVSIGGAEAGEGGDEGDFLIGIGGFGEGLGIAGVGDDFKPVAEPLDDGACDENGTFERVGGLAV